MEWAGVDASLSPSKPVVLTARESREEFSAMEGPGLKKDALGGSSGVLSRASTGASLSTCEPVVLSARESREGFSAMEGPLGLKKDALGASRVALSRASTEAGGVAYSEFTVEMGRSSAMVEGRKEGQGGRWGGRDAKGWWVDIRRPRVPAQIPN